MSAEGIRSFPLSTGEGPGSPPGARALSTGPPRVTPLHEMRLVDAHRAGDPEALGELLAAYQKRVYSICYRMLRNTEEAADLTQDAMVKVLEGLESYDGRSKLSTWIFRVTINCCLSHLRKQKLRKHVSLDAAADGGQTQPDRGGEGLSARPRTARLPAEHSALQSVEQNELRAILQKAMMSLEPEAQAILLLRDMQNLDYEQVAEVMDLPLGTVKSRLFRARTALRAAVEALGGR